MTAGEISQYLGLALAIIALLGHAKGYFSSGEKSLTARVEKTETKLIDHDRRIQTVEGSLRYLPTRDDQHKIELALSAMSGRFDALEERLKPIAITSERLHELLMEQARK